jgi:glycosyltransferase involved in cell wall biosynthesis
MGQHSGLSPLLRVIEQKLPGVVCPVSSAPDPSQAALALLVRLARGCGIHTVETDWARIRNSGIPFYSHNSWIVERRIVQQVKRSAPNWVVLPGVEDQLYLLAKERPKWSVTRLAGISHQPPEWWQSKHAHPEVLESLDGLVVLSSEAKHYWEKRLDPERVWHIPHGVDTDFFCPGTMISSPSDLHVVFCGQYLRDFETLCSVITKIESAGLPIHFDLVVPPAAQAKPAYRRMVLCRNVTTHASISDKQLREIYRKADLLLLPLLGGTANNSLLEAMACGLPVIVTDIGGARDYTTPKFADYVQPRSVHAIMTLLEKYTENKSLLAARGVVARAHAESEFSWRLIAARFLGMLQRRRA